MNRRALAVMSVLLAGTCSMRGASGAPREPSAETRVALVWIFGDDDAANPPNESTPPSPAASIGDRSGYDPLLPGHGSRYTGRENRIELRLRGQARDLAASLETTAELALGIDATGLGESGGDARGEPLRAEDLGSFVEARLSLASRSCAGRSGGRAVSLRLYPVDGDLERVGWLEAAGWGGAVGPRRESPYATAAGAVRAARLTLELPPALAFVGFKTATFVEPVPNAPAVAETSYGVFGGVEARPAELVRLGVAAGAFEHGMLDGAPPGARATTAGVSAMLSLQRGMDEPRSPTTFLGAGDDPFRASGDAPPGAFAIGVEAAALVQRLGDFDRPGRTTLVPARAFAAFGGARLGPFETSAALLLRDPEFVMRNAPGVFAGRGLPAAALRDFERVVLLSNGMVFSALLRADLALGLRFPAAVMTAALDRLGQPTGATLVVNGPGDVVILPVGSVPVPIFDARGSVEARLSSLVSAVAWLSYRRDYNRTRLVGAGAGESDARGFAEPDRLGYGVAARAVW